jgi:hypothetical protein
MGRKLKIGVSRLLGQKTRPYLQNNLSKTGLGHSSNHRTPVLHVPSPAFKHQNCWEKYFKKETP